MEDKRGKTQEPRDRKQEARGEKPEAGSMGELRSAARDGVQRRKMIGWMGLGIVGALTVNKLPFRFLSRRVSAAKALGAKKAHVAINDMAVKRTGKASRNG